MKIGVLGAGQLGRMLALAGYPLGFQFRFLDHNPAACAGQVGELIVGEFNDYRALDRFVDGLDVVTYEFENVPVEAAQYLSSKLPVLPGAQALATAQDRAAEKSCFKELGIPTPLNHNVNDESDISKALGVTGLPAVFKTRRHGYDGKGQLVAHSEAEALQAWEKLGRVPLICEQHVPFERELSMVAARQITGECVFYPLTENWHTEGILRKSVPQTNINLDLQSRAESKIRSVMDHLGYVGVMALEFFLHKGRLLANEMAPRVHNSGHWTMDAGCVSQFENHLRAIAGLPLGSTQPLSISAMINLIGHAPEVDSILRAEPTARVHLYGKDPKPGRKLGHINITAPGLESLKRKTERLSKLVGG
ncbi:MAG: 5-(carboxyamino)imidazole ribonucleotide synthase [Candidatus Sumerlaeaceae bacterium]|nr:5-(carboxyamino)imidazole ribonucleotide synthase [Candidatus Sumerlaeaceae bacterium]